jgi:hypothetical protein
MKSRRLLNRTRKNNERTLRLLVAIKKEKGKSDKNKSDKSKRSKKNKKSKKRISLF